jgi:hypothetical protein
MTILSNELFSFFGKKKRRADHLARKRHSQPRNITPPGSGDHTETFTFFGNLVNVVDSYEIVGT